MSSSDEDSPAVTKALEDLHTPGLTFERLGDDGFETVRVDEMTPDEKALAMVILHQRQLRKLT